MAFDVGSIIAKIKLDMSEFNKGLKDARDRVDDFGDSFSKGTKSITDFGEKSAAGLLVVKTALVAFATKAAFSAARVDELRFALYAIAKANKISTTEVDAAVEALRKNNISLEKSLEITSLFIQSELKLIDTVKLSTAAKDLAVISGMDSSTATKTLTEAIASQEPTLLRQFGIVKNLPQIYEEYAKGLNKTTTVHGESTKAYKKAAEGIGELNDKLAIEKQRLAEAEGNAKTKASTLMSLKNNVQNLEEKIASSNGTMSQYAGKMVSVSKSSKKAGDNLSELEKKQAFLNAILEAGGKVVGTYDASVGSVSKRFRSLKGRIIPDIIVQIGRAFTPALGVIVDGITDGIKFLSKWLTENKEVIKKWGVEFAEKLKIAGGILKDVFTWLVENKGLVIGVLVGIGVAIAAFGVSVAIANAPLLILLAVFALLGLGIQKLAEAMPGIIEWFKQTGESIKNFVDSAKTKITDFVTDTIDWFKKLPDQAGAFLHKLFTEDIPYAVGFAAGWLATNIPIMIGNVVTWFQELPGKILAVLEMVKNHIVERFTAAWNWLSTEVSTWPGRIEKLINSIPITVEKVFSDAKDAVLKQMSDTWDGVSKWWDKVKGILEGIKNAANDAIDAVKRGFEAGKVGTPKLFAKGVRNFAGGLAIVGEQGPELVNLPRGSDVIPNSAFGSPGASSISNISVNISLDGAIIADDYSANRISEKIGNQIIRKMQTQLRF